MNKLQAKLMLAQIIPQQVNMEYKFACIGNGCITQPSIFEDAWNIEFTLDGAKRNIQVALDFHAEAVDVVIFPHPELMREEFVCEVIRFINAINADGWLQKFNGRLYVDEEFLDVTYSVRFAYTGLIHQRWMDTELAQAFLCFLVDKLYEIGHGELMAADAYREMRALWEE